jgi:hypothetical protein
VNKRKGIETDGCESIRDENAFAILKNKLVMKIIVTNRTSDVHAQVEGRPEIWGCGANRNEAIGNLISAHQELSNAEVFDQTTPIDMKRKIIIKYEVPSEFYDDIMVTALEGGINYWCEKATAKDDNFHGAEFVSDVIGKGGIVIIHPDDESGEEPKELTADMIDLALQQLIDRNGNEWILKILNQDIDAGDADTIIQQAVFGEQIFA